MSLGKGYLQRFLIEYLYLKYSFVNDSDLCICCHLGYCYWTGSWISSFTWAVQVIWAWTAGYHLDYFFTFSSLSYQCNKARGAPFFQLFSSFKCKCSPWQQSKWPLDKSLTHTPLVSAAYPKQTAACVQLMWGLVFVLMQSQQWFWVMSSAAPG